MLAFEAVAPFTLICPPKALKFCKLINVGGEFKVNVTVFPQAGVCVAAKLRLIGCAVIPTVTVVEAGGGVEMVRVWTSHVMVTAIILVIEATRG